MVDVVGWVELNQGNIFLAAYNLYNTILGGWFVAILFCVFQILLYMKTRNFVLMWITGLFFMGMYATGSFLRNNVYLAEYSVFLIFGLLILELAGILYMVFFK